MKTLLAALGLMLIFEGFLPFAAPGKWREMFAQISKLSDGQIRFVGLGAVGLGLLFLLLA